MADSNSSSPSNSTPSAPAPSTSTLGTNAVGQAASAQAQKAQAQAAPKTAPKGPNQVPGASSAPKQAAQAQAVINDPNAPKAAKVQAKKMLKQLTIKVDGQDTTETLPFEIPDDPKTIEWMTRELQMSRMGQKRAQYAAGLEKDIKQFVEDFKADPFKAMQDPAFNIDTKQAVKRYIEQEIENSKKSPEQLELEKTRAELKAERDQKLAEKAARDAQENQALADRYEQEYDAQITNALESNKIPKSQAAVSKILAYAQLAVQANKDVSINDIIPFVQEELINDYRAHAAALPDEALEEFFGKEVVDRLRKTAVKRAKQAQQNPALRAPGKAPSTGKAAEPAKADEKKVTYKQFFKPW